MPGGRGGRPPKPTQQKAEQGTLRKDRERGKAPEPPPMQKVPPAPPGLPPEQRETWKRYATVLVTRRYLAEDGGDLLALEAMVREWHRYLQLHSDVYKEGAEGVVLIKIDGTVYRNPKDVAMNAALANWFRLAVEFGLTTAARVRARGAATAPPKPENPFAEFKGRVLPGSFGGSA